MTAIKGEFSFPRHEREDQGRDVGQECTEIPSGVIFWDC